MINLIIIFGALIILMGIVLIIKPNKVFDILNSFKGSVQLYVLAILVRFLLGALLLYMAASSKYPFAIEFIGWLSIAAATIFTLIGPKRFSRLMTWAISFSGQLGHIGGVLALAFGGFLIHAFY